MLEIATRYCSSDRVRAQPTNNAIESHVCGSVVGVNPVPEGKWKVFYLNQPTFSSVGLSAAYEFVGVIRYRPGEVVIDFGAEAVSFCVSAWLLNKLLGELQALGEGRSAADQAALAEFTAAARAL